MTDRSQILERIARAEALANTSETVDEIGRWSTLEWELREVHRPNMEERRAITRQSLRFQQIYQQDEFQRRRAEEQETMLGDRA